MPPELRSKLGLDRLKNPMLLVEEKDGKLFLEPATAVPVRDLPEATIRGWIVEDEKAMKALQSVRKTAKRK